MGGVGGALGHSCGTVGSVGGADSPVERIGAEDASGGEEGGEAGRTLRLVEDLVFLVEREGVLVAKGEEDGPR